MKTRRPWARPLVPFYTLALGIERALRDRGVLTTRTLRAPVLSVGSLSAGGAGKTPVVIALADLLAAHGWHVDVLSRGYGRSPTAVERVDANAPDAARRFGDEPVLIARRTAASVWVGADRFAAGSAAEAAAARTSHIVHLLDDGFQHRQLARAFDLVLVTAEDLDDALLPAGNRREPLSAVGRADAVLVREQEQPLLAPRLQPLLKAGTPIWILRRRLALPEHLLAAPNPVTAFCGIARPEGFFSMLRASGVSLATALPFPDHHTYTIQDVRRVVKSCHLEGCKFVTTEKDAVKLGPELRAEFGRAGTLEIARLEVEFADPVALLDTLEARLQ